MRIITEPGELGWPHGYLHHAKEGDVLQAGLSLLASGLGFRAGLVDCATRHPVTRNGVKDFSPYGADLYGMWEAFPDQRVPALAVTMPRGYAVVDYDNIDFWQVPGRAGWNTATEWTADGWHQFVSLPEPITSTTRHQHGELRAGPDNYTIIWPSPEKGYFELGGDPCNTRWFRDLPDDSAIWINALRAMADNCANHLEPSQFADERLPETDRLITRLVNGRYGASVTAIMQGCWQDRYNSRSEADFALVFLATHFTVNPVVLADLIRRYSRKLRDKSTPSQKASYLSLTIFAAIRSRHLTNLTRLNSIAHSLHLPDYSLSPPPTPKPTNVYVAEKWEPGVLPGLNGMRKGQRKEELVASLLAWGGLAGNGDRFDFGNGWRRLPVDDFAAMFGYTRDGIRKVYLGLLAAGLIDREVPNTRSDKGPRNTTLIRLKEGR